MQQQVVKRILSSGMGWGTEGEGNRGLQTSPLGSGSWTSTANQDTPSASSTWQSSGKSETASEGGDDASSVKSGSAMSSMSNITSQQSQDSTNTSSASGALTGSASPWSTNPSLASIETSPWGRSNSPAPTSVGSIGWNPNPTSLSLSTNQASNSNMQSGTGIVGSNTFNSSSGTTSSSGWPGMSGTTVGSMTVPPNMSTALQQGSISSQWQGSTMLGNIGDFPKTSESSWNNPNSSMMDNAVNKDLTSNSDPRMWGLSSDKSSEGQWDPNKSHWGNSPMATGGEQGPTNNSELSFAQATLKGLKVPPASCGPQPTVNSRNEEILRAIENHEGWGSRPIRQDTSWDVDGSPKSSRKFSTDNNAGASNVWNNSNGTAIWEAVRENQTSNWGGAASGTSWNGEKDQSNWNAPSKPPQDPSTWGNAADSKTFGTWGGGGAGDASNKMWGQKTEIGSWGEGGGNVQRTTSISSWNEDVDAGGWEDQRRITGGGPGGMSGPMQGMVPPSPGIGGPAGMPNMPGIIPQGMPTMNMPGMGTDATSWNDNQKQSWNSANPAALQRAKMDEPWNKPPPKVSAWGDPPQDGVKVDDGTSIWAANAPKQLPPQAKASGWGDTGPQAQWNAAVGAKPNTPAGWDEAAWAHAQRAKSGGYSDVSTSSVEVGYWNGIPQDNSSWNDPAAYRGVRKITGQQVPPKYPVSGGHPQGQMRSKLLQHLMEMGFRKEEAQKALITNNMNLELAVNDLKANSGMPRKDLDMEMFQANGSHSRMPFMPKGGLGEDMADIRPDQVPNFSTNIQNTPFPNAQVPNQQFIQHNPSLPPSSLNPNPSNNPSIQQRLIQKMQQPQAPSGPRNQLPPMNNSASSNQVPQQQQQQILAQLRMAVNNGFISSQLLNYTLPHNILVLLQQLLQHQSARQTVISKQQQMMQQGNRAGNRQQIEHMSTVINNINQQMVMLQKQLQQAQNNFFSSQKPPNVSHPPSGMMTPLPGQQPGGAMIDNIDAISSDLANVSMSQPQSRLTHWKSNADSQMDGSSTPTGTISMNSGNGNENEDKSGKGLLHSSSSPNLNLIPGGLGMTGDRTWSSISTPSSSQNWPSSPDVVSSNSQGDSKIVATSSSTGITDGIPEFVPGKPWQGLAKMVEDDPHLTPGSLIQRSLSVNRVADESLSTLSGTKLSGINNTWSGGKNENTLGLSQLGSRPPPSTGASKVTGSQQWQGGVSGTGFNRQNSWAGHSGNSAFTKVGGSNWNEPSQGSNWILLKNLNYADSNTVRAMCSNHGSIANFYYMSNAQAALVQYANREVAFIAQRALNNFQMGLSVIVAEFISESDAQRYASQMPPPHQQSAMPPINTSQWSQAPPTTPFQSGIRGGDPWSSTSQANKLGSSSGDLWSTPSWSDMSVMGDHNSNLGNFLGSESM